MPSAGAGTHPAYRGFDAEHTAGAQIHLRLVMQQELAVRVAAAAQFHCPLSSEYFLDDP